MTGPGHPRPFPRIALGMVPTASVTPRIRDRAAAHEWDRHLYECRGRTAPTFSPPDPDADTY